MSVSAVTVAPEYRRLGLAQTLMDYFEHVSIHAPSKLVNLSESELIDCLAKVAAYVHGIVVHPDLFAEVDRWAILADKVYIENMDNRKPIGRTASELRPFFDALPEARFCLDLGHAWQIDPAMQVATELLDAFHPRLAELHVSEVNTKSQHCPVSRSVSEDFRLVAAKIPSSVPAIVESEIEPNAMFREMRTVQYALGDVSSPPS